MRNRDYYSKRLAIFKPNQPKPHSQFTILHTDDIIFFKQWNSVRKTADNKLNVKLVFGPWICLVLNKISKYFMWTIQCVNNFIYTGFKLLFIIQKRRHRHITNNHAHFMWMKKKKYDKKWIHFVLDCVENDNLCSIMLCQVC